MILLVSEALVCCRQAREWAAGWGDPAQRCLLPGPCQADANLIHAVHRAGALLGTGSYGRVYHGRWMEREVAVKVSRNAS